MTDDVPRADLLAVLTIAGAAIESRVLAGLIDAGFDTIRPAHGYVVQRLLTGPQLVSAMAVDLGVSQQAISKMVKELVRLGFAAQRIDADDSRRRPIMLTDRGRAAVEKARAVRRELENDLRRTVGSDDLAAAQRVLSALIEHLGLTKHVAARTVPAPLED